MLFAQVRLPAVRLRWATDGVTALSGPVNWCPRSGLTTKASLTSSTRGGWRQFVWPCQSCIYRAAASWFVSPWNEDSCWWSAGVRIRCVARQILWTLGMRDVIWDGPQIKSGYTFDSVFFNFCIKAKKTSCHIIQRLFLCHLSLMLVHVLMCFSWQVWPTVGYRKKFTHFVPFRDIFVSSAHRNWKKTSFECVFCDFIWRTSFYYCLTSHSNVSAL